MALPIRDGNQSLTTLSTILVSNSHIPAHTVISFGTQGITDIATAVSGVELGPNTLNALENITVTLGQVTITGGLTDAQLRASAVTIGGSVTATISGTPSVTFTQASVTFGTAVITGSTSILNFPASQTVTFTTAPVTFGTSVVTGSVSVLNIPATQTVTFSQAPVTFGIISGTVTANPTGTQTIAGSVTLGAGTAQIGSVTASISGTVTANVFGSDYQGNPLGIPVEIDSNGIGEKLIPIGFAASGDARQVSYAYPLPISGTVTANVFGKDSNQIAQPIRTALIGSEDLVSGYRLAVGLANNIGYEFGTAYSNPFLVGGYSIENDATKTLSVTTAGDVRAVLTFALPAGTNRIGVVTIGAGTVTIGAGTAQIGSVTASISNFPATQAVSLTTLPALVAGTAQIGSVTVGNTVTIAGTVTANPTGTQAIAGSVTIGAGIAQIGSVTVGNSVTIGSLPAISGTVTANLSISATTITSGSFTSLASATLVPANTARKMATVYNLGAGQLFINAGATATTLGGGFMVVLSSGDFYECNYTTTTLSAIFSTAGTASWISH